MTKLGAALAALSLAGATFIATPAISSAHTQGSVGSIANSRIESPSEQGPIQVNLGPGAQPVPKELKFAWSFVIADANTGEILAAKDKDRQLPLASTLKTLTALTTMPHLDPNSTYLGTSQDENAEGMHAGVKTNASYTVNDLFHGMLMPSGNDAASAVANANGGWDQTITAMNKEAKRIGAVNTNAVNPSGLDAEGQHSTAEDLTIIMRNALAIPEFQAIQQEKSYTFPGPILDDNKKPVKTRGNYQIYTTNRLLLDDYPGTLAGKTGFTSQAGRTFVAAAEKDGRKLVVSLMRSARSTEVMSKSLLEWGFANAALVTPIGQLPDVAPPIIEPKVPALKLTADGAVVPGQEEIQASLTAANQGRGNQAAAQVTGAELGSSLLSGLVTPLLWLATIAMIAVTILRIRVMLITSNRRGSNPSSPRPSVDLRAREYENSSAGRPSNSDS